MLIDMNMRETETTVYMLIEVDLYLWFQQSSYRSFGFFNAEDRCSLFAYFVHFPSNQAQKFFEYCGTASL